MIERVGENRIACRIEDHVEGIVQRGVGGGRVRVRRHTVIGRDRAAAVVGRGLGPGRRRVPALLARDRTLRVRVRVIARPRVTGSRRASVARVTDTNRPSSSCFCAGSRGMFRRMRMILAIPLR